MVFDGKTFKEQIDVLNHANKMLHQKVRSIIMESTYKNEVTANLDDAQKLLYLQDARRKLIKNIEEWDKDNKENDYPIQPQIGSAKLSSCGVTLQRFPNNHIDTNSPIHYFNISLCWKNEFPEVMFLEKDVSALKSKMFHSKQELIDMAAWSLAKNGWIKSFHVPVEMRGRALGTDLGIAEALGNRSQEAATTNMIKACETFGLKPSNVGSFSPFIWNIRGKNDSSVRIGIYPEIVNFEFQFKENPYLVVKRDWKSSDSVFMIVTNVLIDEKFIDEKKYASAIHKYRGELLGHDLGISENVQEITTMARSIIDEAIPKICTQFGLSRIIQNALSNASGSFFQMKIAAADFDKDLSKYVEMYLNALNPVAHGNNVLFTDSKTNKLNGHAQNFDTIEEFTDILMWNLIKGRVIDSNELKGTEFEHLRGSALGKDFDLVENVNIGTNNIDETIRSLCKKFKMTILNRSAGGGSSLRYDIDPPYPNERRSLEFWIYTHSNEMGMKYDTYEHDPWDNDHEVKEFNAKWTDKDDLVSKWLYQLLNWNLISDKDLKKYRGEFLGKDFGIAEKLITEGELNTSAIPSRGLFRNILLKLVPELCQTLDLRVVYQGNTKTFVELDLYRSDSVGKGLDVLKKTRLILSINVYGDGDPNNNVVFSSEEWSTGTSDYGPNKVLCFKNIHEFESLLLKYLAKAGTIDGDHERVKKFRGQYMGQDLGIAENYFKQMSEKNSHKSSRLIDFNTFINEDEDDARKREMLFKFEKIVTVANFNEKVNLPRVQKYLAKSGFIFETRKDEEGKEYLYLKLPEHEMHRAGKNKVISILRNAGFTGLHVYGCNILKTSFQKDPDVV